MDAEAPSNDDALLDDRQWHIANKLADVLMNEWPTTIIFRDAALVTARAILAIPEMATIASAGATSAPEANDPLDRKKDHRSCEENRRTDDMTRQLHFAARSKIIDFKLPAFGQVGKVDAHWIDRRDAEVRGATLGDALTTLDRAWIETETGHG